jgi:hypothetical protein
MDIGQSFTYIFDDEKWLNKMLIGGILLFVPIVGLFIVVGYMLQTLKNVNQSHANPLPEWDDFGTYLTEGFKFSLAYFVYYIPALLIFGCMFISIFALILFAEQSATGDVPMALLALTFCGQFLYLLALLIPFAFLPAALIRYAETGQMKAVFNLRQIWPLMKADMGSYFMVLLITFGATSVLGGLGVVLCLVGVVFTQWWSYLIVAHLTGQYMRQIRSAHPEVILNG